MVHRKEGHNEWMSWQKGEWRAYFKKHGVKAKLPELKGTVVERAFEAAQFLTDNGFKTFSGIELAALANLDNWTAERSRAHLAMLYGETARYYVEEGRSIPEIPAIQLLRMEVGAYQGNLHRFLGYEMTPDGQLIETPKAIQSLKIPGLEVSADDWQRSICLPECCDEETARLFGYYWGAGTIVKHNGITGSLVVSVRKSKKAILEKRVKPLIERVHGLEVKSNHKTEDNYRDKKRKIERNYLCVNSAALASYLHKEHGMPWGTQRKEEVKRRIRKHKLPNLPWHSELINAFLIGLLEVRARMSAGRLILQGTGDYGIGIGKLLREQNQYSYSGPHFRENSLWYIEFNRDSIEALKEQLYA